MNWEVFWYVTIVATFWWLWMVVNIRIIDGYGYDAPISRERWKREISVCDYLLKGECTERERVKYHSSKARAETIIRVIEAINNMLSQIWTPLGIFALGMCIGYWF